MNKLYYLIKSFIPRWLQIYIRRFFLTKKLNKYKHIWPVDYNSAKPPENWKGWPDGKKFALVLTHDVESIRGLNKCRELMKIEEELGFRSSFNFVAGDYEVPIEFINELKTRGFEAGIHGLHHDGNPFRSKAVFSKQVPQINQFLKKWNAVGFRSPSMYHNLEWVHDLNIDYDASTFDTDPFEPQPDAAGTIFPFFVSGNSNQKGYIELPYTLPQDFLLYILMKEKNIEIWKNKLDWIVDNGGMVLLITHPDYINFSYKNYQQDEYPVKFYMQFLDYIKNRHEGQYWNTLPTDIAQFWREKLI